jgi:predicted nuclease of predicted toxin-antitoxin system
VVSKRKEKIRSDARFEDGWFEVSEGLWREPGAKPQKLRLLADANFPGPLVEILQHRGFEVQTAKKLNIHRLADQEILQEAEKRKLLLITLDRHFWSDDKFPLRPARRLVFIDAQDERIKNTDGFELLLILLESWGGAQRYGKIRSTSESVYLKLLNKAATRRIYEFKAIRPYIYARECLKA